jgi:hypothetical protein
MSTYTGGKVRIATEEWSRDGNVFFIIGRVSRAMRDQGFTDEEVRAFQAEASSGDYDHALQTVFAYTADPDEDESAGQP